MLYFIYFLVFILGLSVGSFANCLSWRLGNEESTKGRSRCPKCLKQLAWYDNIPLLSFVLLRAKCRSCGKKISWQYFWVELALGVLFVIAFYFSPFSTLGELSNGFWHPLALLFRNWILICFLTIIFIMDLRWKVIVDKVSLPACVIMLAFNLLLGFSWQNIFLSATIGAGFFLLQFIISQGKWIGGGDIRLGLLMGLALGWPEIITALALSYFIGGIFGIFWLLTGKKKKGAEVPFGTFLAVGTVIALFCGEWILQTYLILL